jgi:hypothetical protein
MVQNLSWTTLVYRVNWLRAKARFNRWDEEDRMVRSEMRWTILYFLHQQEVWKKRAEKSIECDKRGHRAYALKQADMWGKFAAEGKTKFDGFMT